MNKLRFLKIRGFPRPMANSFQSSVQLPNGLRWLCWNHYPGKCLGKTVHPTELVHLEMCFSLVERTPDFSHLPNLEVLDLYYSEKLVHIHPSLGLHIKIRRINLAGCSKLKEFPAIVLMNSLESLNLWGTYLHPNILDESIKYATGLRNLDLGRCGLTTLPELPSSLQILKMVSCLSLTEYPKSFPSHLKILKITHSKIGKTPDFNQLPNLLELDMSGSEKLSEVHASLGVHQKIERICLTFCRNLCYFPAIVDMRCLETLDLSRTKLQCFPEITGRVDNLAKLNLEETWIRTLPHSIGRARGLKKLDLTRCRFLVSLPTSLQPLEELEILQ